MRTVSPGRLQFAGDLTRADSIDDLTRRLYAGIDQVFDAVVVGFDLLDPVTHRPRSTSAQGVSRFFLARYDRVARAADPVLNRAIDSQDLAYNLAMMSPEEWQDSGIYRDVFSLHHMTGIVYAPVIVAGSVIGTLNLGRAADGAVFNADELQDAGELAVLLGSIIASLWQRASLERELQLFRMALDTVSEAVVISDMQQAARYANRAALDVLAGQPADAPSLDEALIELQSRMRPQEQGGGLVQRTISLGAEEAFVAFLRPGGRRDELPDWLHRTLTPREIDVVVLVVTGLRDAEIAQRLNLSVHTVKGYLREVFKKTGARSRVELARMTVDGVPE